jgi:hypothetical protein
VVESLSAPFGSGWFYREAVIDHSPGLQPWGHVWTSFVLKGRPNGLVHGVPARLHSFSRVPFLHDLIPLMATPSITNFWANKKIRITGNTAMLIAAITTDRFPEAMYPRSRSIAIGSVIAE